MTTPYTRTVTANNLTGGQHATITLPAHARGILTRLIVKQTSGTVSGFQFDTYDRLDACTGQAAEKAL